MSTPDNTPATPHPDTRDGLIRAALSCFATYGYDATSIRQIAAAAGKNSSLISYYFGGKEGLYRAVFQHLLWRVGAAPLAPWDPGPGSEAERLQRGWTRLRELIRHLLAEVEAHFHRADPQREAATRLFLSEMHNPRDEVKDLLQARLEPEVQAIRDCLRCLRPDLEPADLDFWGLTVQGCCVGHSLQTKLHRLVWPALDPALTLDDMADRLTAFVSQGLLHRGAPAADPFPAESPSSRSHP